MSIKFYIDRWLSSRSNRTLSSLSRATDVPLSTIRRLHAGDGGLPDAKSILPLLAVVCDVAEMSEYVHEHYPEVSRYYEIIATGDDRYLKPEPIDRYVFESREAYFTFCLAYARLATVQRIETLFGSYGLQTADELVTSGYIVKRGDEYIPVDGRAFVFQNHHEMTAKQIQHVVSIAKKSQEHDSLFTGVFSTDDAGRAEIEALTKAYLENLVAIAKRDVENRHAVAVGLAYTRVVDESPTQKKDG